MTRKSIQTNGPVVSCDVCGRTLLRGEHADVFLHSGSRRMVCQLCTARAAHEGWIREGLDDATVRSNGDGRRRGSFLARLRSRRADHTPPSEPLAAPAAPAGYEAELGEPEWVYDDEPVEELPPPPPPVPVPTRAERGRERGGRDRGGRGDRAAASVAPREHRSIHAVPTNADLKMARALELFNASSHRRTVTGVARSLGSPLVAVRPSPTEGSVVTIAVAWELSWYRYEVDLADEASGVRVADQGAELHELDPADQQPNAAADDSGALHLVAQHA